VLVFVEVKYRKNNAYGGAINAISALKQKKIISAAQFFLQKNNLNPENQACRFDVIAIEGSDESNNGKSQQIHWLKNAFSN